MTRRVFVDTANNSKPHVCYDPVEDRFFEVNDLGELVGRYDEVYIDSSLFPNMWPQLKALIDNDIRIFYFAWPWKWKELREKYAKELRRKFGKKKTDYGDAYILAKIHGEPKAFKEVTPLDVEFKPLLMIEKALADEIQRLRRRQMLGINVEDLIEVYEEHLMRIRRRIVKEALEKIPSFMEIAERLALNNNDVNALSALTGLLVYLRWPYKVPSFHKAKRFLGLYKPTKKDVEKFEESGRNYRKHYSGRARRYLSLLTAAILRKENIFPPRARDEKEVLRGLLKVLRIHNEAARRAEGQDKSPEEARGPRFDAP